MQINRMRPERHAQERSYKNFMAGPQIKPMKNKGRLRETAVGCTEGDLEKEKKNKTPNEPLLSVYSLTRSRNPSAFLDNETALEADLG